MEQTGGRSELPVGLVPEGMARPLMEAPEEVGASSGHSPVKPGGCPEWNHIG